MPKYQRFPQIPLNARKWPDKIIEKAPIWCSVDLRDGNQALVNPMGVDQKLKFFDLLVKIGFKEIEVGFPASSQIEFDFCRRLIDEGRIPDDVTIQVLCQAREHLIERTLEAIQGAKKAIFHLYNSTNPAQREMTFGMSREEVKNLAVDGVKILKGSLSRLEGCDLRFEYSPESFSQTELDFALEVCEAVKAEWKPSKAKPIILNLPNTVEVCLPNQHADQIEWMHSHFSTRETVILSLHTHNDRGTGVASAELGLLAGAERVEGTLFGNGERTGNLDLMILALNMQSHGIETGLDFSRLPEIVEIYEECTDMKVHERHPYAGELVFTAFSGSHQDAIKKAMEFRARAIETTAKRQPSNGASATGSEGASDLAADVEWNVPYLPIDPKDIGRSYEAIIRINSQSGKGGVAFILKDRFGLELPRPFQAEVGTLINAHADRSGRELSPEELWAFFASEYLDKSGPLALVRFLGEELRGRDGVTTLKAEIGIDGKKHSLKGTGVGPVEAFVKGLAQIGYNGFEVVDFHENSMGRGTNSRAAAFVKVRKTGTSIEAWGCGLDSSITLAGIRALSCAINRLAKESSGAGVATPAYAPKAGVAG